MKKLILLFFLFLLIINCTKIRTNDILDSDFENEEIGNWKGRGSAKITVSNETSYKGKYSLLTNNRTDSWNGPSIDLTDKVFSTGTYRFSAWIKIKNGQPDNEMIMTIERSKNKHRKN